MADVDQTTQLTNEEVKAIRSLLSEASSNRSKIDKLTTEVATLGGEIENLKRAWRQEEQRGMRE